MSGDFSTEQYLKVRGDAYLDALMRIEEHPGPLDKDVVARHHRAALDTIEEYLDQHGIAKRSPSDRGQSAGSS